MHPGLHRAILEYLADVERAVALLLESGFERTPYGVDWVAQDSKKPEFLLGGVSYFKHGGGYAVQLEPHSVDFDFGPGGETNRFELVRLHHYTRGRLAEFGLPPSGSLDPLVDDALREGTLRTKDGHEFFLCANDA